MAPVLLFSEHFGVLAMAATSKDVENELVDKKNLKSSKLSCACCKSGVESGVRCMVCGKTFHNSCMGRTAGLLVCGKGAVICCRKYLDISSQTEESTKEIPSQIEVLNLESNYLKQIISDKCGIIAELRNVVKYQEEVIKLLKDKNCKNGGTNDNKVSSKKLDLGSVASEHLDKSEASYRAAQGNVAQLEVAQKEIMKNIIDLEQGAGPLTNGVSTVVNVKNKANSTVSYAKAVKIAEKDTKSTQDSVNPGIPPTKKVQSVPKTIYATGASNSKSDKVVGSIRKKWIYVGKISGNDVTVDDINEYLYDLKDLKHYDKIEITKLNTLGKNSAFCIGLPTDELYGKVFNQDYWVEGISLREFDLRKTFLSQKRKKNVEQTGSGRQ